MSCKLITYTKHLKQSLSYEVSVGKCLLSISDNYHSFLQDISIFSNWNASKVVRFQTSPPTPIYFSGQNWSVRQEKRGKEGKQKEGNWGSRTPLGRDSRRPAAGEKEVGAFHRQAQVKQRLRAEGCRSRVEAVSRGRKPWKFQAYKWTAGSGPFLAESFLYFTFLDKWQMIVAANPASCCPRGAAN